MLFTFNGPLMDQCVQQMSPNKEKHYNFNLAVFKKSPLTLSEPQVHSNWLTVINNNKWCILSPQLLTPLTFPSSTH